MKKKISVLWKRTWIKLSKAIKVIEVRINLIRVVDNQIFDSWRINSRLLENSGVIRWVNIFWVLSIAVHNFASVQFKVGKFTRSRGCRCRCRSCRCCGRFFLATNDGYFLQSDFRVGFFNRREYDVHFDDVVFLDYFFVEWGQWFIRSCFKRTRRFKLKNGWITRIYCNLLS